MSNNYTPDLVPLQPGEIARADDVNDRYENTVQGFDRLPTPKDGEQGFSAPVPVGTPISADHATTKDWVETSMTSQVNQAATSASNAQTSATNAALSESAAATSESNASASEAAASASESASATSESNAETSASNAATSESNASSAQTAAEFARDQALGYRDNAATSASNASTSETNAANSASAASTSAGNAAGSETLAQQWATNPEDSIVTAGQYSAFHWAQKAEDFALSAVQEAPIDGSQYARSNGGWVVTSAEDNRISATQISNWDTAFSWGDHAAENYPQQLEPTNLTSANDLGTGSTTTLTDGWYQWGSSLPAQAPAAYGTMLQNTENQPIQLAVTYGGTSNRVDLYGRRRTSSTWDSTWTKFWNSVDFSSTDISNWNTAFGWGNHASAGYAPASTTLTTNTTQNITSPKEFQDDVELRFGNGADFRIDHNSNGHTYFRNYNHAAGNIYFQGEDAEGSNTALIYMYTNLSRTYVALFENGAEKLRTTSSGVSVTGTVTATTFSGNATSATDCSRIPLATGNYGTIKVNDDRGVTWAGYAIRDDWVLMSNGANDCGIYNDTDNEWMTRWHRNAQTEIHHNGAVKLATTSTGIAVTGTATGTFSGAHIINASSTLSNDLVVPSANRNRGVFGTYDSTKTQHIWSMGTAYRNNSAGASFGNLYGAAYVHPNAGLGSFAGGHQLAWCQNGSATSAIGSNVWTSGNVTAYSDIRVKTNIEVIPNALEKVCSVSGYTFDRTDHSLDVDGDDVIPKRQTGVIAQEILEILPEAVVGGPTENDPDGHYSVAYGNLAGLLIEAIKELNQKVEALEARLAEQSQTERN